MKTPKITMNLTFSKGFRPLPLNLSPQVKYFTDRSYAILLLWIFSVFLSFFSSCFFELQLNKANFSDTEALFSDLNLSITYGIVSSKIYDKRDDFNF